MPRPTFRLDRTADGDVTAPSDSLSVTIFGTGSAREWIHIFNGAGYVTGVSIEAVPNDFGYSDHKSFLDRGVPAVMFFGGVHLDYHRPSDTFEKIDSAGMIKVARVVKEAVEYLAGRPEPLTVTLKESDGAVTSPSAARSSRKVGLGTIPDFSYQGKGVRLSAVRPGSPSEEAGLNAGDIITRLGDTTISDLQAYSDVLKKLTLGDTVTITYTRDEKEHNVQVTTAAR